MTYTDGAAAAEVAGGASAEADPSTHVPGNQHAAAGSGERAALSETRHDAPAAADAAGAAAAQPASQSANGGITQEPATAVAAEPANLAPDAVPLATDDGLLAIGGFDELLASPSQPQPPALRGGLHEGPPEPEAPSDEDAEKDVPNPPVSTEVSRAQQEKTAAAVADEMGHKDHH